MEKNNFIQYTKGGPIERKILQKCLFESLMDTS